MNASLFIRGLVLVSASVLLSACQVTEDQLETYIRGKGFSILVPPSTLYRPGTLVYRENYDPKDMKPTRLSLGYLCNPEHSIDLYKSKARESETLAQVTVTKFGGSISASVPALQKVVDLDGKVKAASSISANIYDAKIYAFAKDDLDSIRDLLGPRCRKIVNGNVPKNAYQVLQVLQASIDINVVIDGGADAKAKAQFVGQLASLGFDVSAGQTASLKGKALFFGVQLEPITTPLVAPDSQLVAGGRALR